MSRLSFRSAEFLPLLPEEAQGNPGAYGFELAWWLAQRLQLRKITTSYPVGEDWGWFIEFVDGEDEFMIGCGAEAEEGMGYLGKPIDWHIFVRQQLSLKQRLSRKARPETVSRLCKAILAELERAGIQATVESAA